MTQIGVCLPETRQKIRFVCLNKVQSGQQYGNPVAPLQQLINPLIRYILIMSKLNIFVTVLVALQLCQVLGGGSGFGFDISKSRTYLNAGSCYVYPGVSTSGSSGSYGVKYYNLPHGWRQYEDKIVIPNVLSSKGEWSFGGRAVSGGNTVNDRFKVSVNGLQVKISSGSSSKNCVIGSNYRSSDVDEKEWKGFLGSLGKRESWLSDDDDSYWFPGTGRQTIKSRSGSSSTSGSKSGSSSSSGSKSSSSSSSSSSGSKTTSTSSSGSRSGSNSREQDSNQGSRRAIGGVLNDLVYFGGSSSTTIFVSTPSQTVTGGPSAEERKRALDQQYSANQALTQVNRLITQLTSSVESTSSSISKLEANVNTFRSTSSQCNDKVLELNKAKLSAERSIEEINGDASDNEARIREFSAAVANLQTRRGELVRQRSEIESSKTPNSKTLNELESQYTSCTSQASTFKTEYSKIQDSINSNNEEISTTKNNAADAPNQINLANEQLSVVDATIAELEAKLNEARTQRGKIQGDIVNYNNIISSSNSRVATLEGENSRLSSQLSGLQSRIDSQVVQCTTFQTKSNEIRTAIASSQQDYDDLTKQIDVQDNLISSKRSELERYQSESKSIPSRLGTFQNDLRNAKTALERQYTVCNQATSQITRAQSDLDAANLKLTTERKFLTQAQAKLVTLTAQKKAADDAVSKLGSVRTSTTTGVRPIGGGISGVVVSGSGSGSILYGFAPIDVGSIGDYLARVYGTGFNSFWQPFIAPSTYCTMYPISPVTVSALYGRSTAGIFLANSGSYLSGITRSQIGSSAPANIIGDFTCGGNDYFTGSGHIVSVQPGYIVVKGSKGETVNLRIGGCSQYESNKPDYVLSVSDRVLYRGKRGLSKDVHLYDLTCLS